MNKQLEALIAEAKLSASIMELIASFEPQDIDGDDVDLRFEADGFDTGCDVSMVEQCGKAAEQLSALIAALEQAQRANAAQDDHINQQQDRIEQLEKGHQEAAKHITSWRLLAKQNIAEREKDIAELDAARNRIAGLEDTLELEREKSRRVMSQNHQLEASPSSVKLHKRSVGEVMHMSGFSRDYAEGWCAGNDNAIHEIRAAGGTVSEGE